VGDVEVDIGVAVLFHDGVDGACGDVARGERAAGVEILHEGSAADIDELGAFAAHRFGNKERFGLGVVEAGRVELDEFHVADRQPRAPGHGHAVAGGDVGVGGVEVDFSQSAGSQHGAGGMDGDHPVFGLVEKVGTDAAVGAFEANPVGGDEVDG